MPVQITRPLAARMVSTALTKRSSRLRDKLAQGVGLERQNAAGGGDVGVLRHAADLDQICRKVICRRGSERAINSTALLRAAEWRAKVPAGRGSFACVVS